MPGLPQNQHWPAGPVRLSPRLQAVADLVPPCRIAYDIGTDHGWLPIWLIQQARCEQAVAADLRTGPLQRASAHINRYGLAEQIRIRQGDGLTGIAAGDRAVVILAGLGGHEIMRILSAAEEPGPTLVVQAMKTLPDLRQWLCEKGYAIQQEILAREKHRFYPVLQACYTGIPCRLTDLEAWIGPVLLREQPPGLAAWIVQLQKQLHRQLNGNQQLQSLIDQTDSLLRSIAASETQD